MAQVRMYGQFKAVIPDDDMSNLVGQTQITFRLVFDPAKCDLSKLELWGRFIIEKGRVLHGWGPAGDALPEPIYSVGIPFPLLVAFYWLTEGNAKVEIAADGVSAVVFTISGLEPIRNPLGYLRMLDSKLSMWSAKANADANAACVLDEY